MQKAAQQSVHLTGGILRHFRAFSTPEQNPALEVLSTPAHPQVTQTVSVPCRENLWVFSKNKVSFKLGLSLQNQVSGFQKSFG